VPFRFFEIVFIVLCSFVSLLGALRIVASAATENPYGTVQRRRDSHSERIDLFCVHGMFPQRTYLSSRNRFEQYWFLLLALVGHLEERRERLICKAALGFVL
jgi:hypothetical protein